MIEYIGFIFLIIGIVSYVILRFNYKGNNKPLNIIFTISSITSGIIGLYLIIIGADKTKIVIASLIIGIPLARYLILRFNLRKYLFYLLPISAILSILSYFEVVKYFFSVSIIIVAGLIFITQTKKEINLKNLKSMNLKKIVYEPKITRKHIGGFVLPFLFPKKIFINKYFNRRGEADIHESVHQFLLFERGWLFYYFMILTISLTSISILFNLGEYEHLIIIISSLPILVSCMVYFEYATFKITKRLYTEAKSWDKELFFKYLIFYSIQLIIMLSFVYIIDYFWGVA